MRQHDSNAQLERLLRTTGNSPSVGFTDRLLVEIAKTPQEERSRASFLGNSQIQSRSGAAWVAGILLDPLTLGSTAGFAIIALGWPVLQPLVESTFLAWPRWISLDLATSWAWSLWGLCAAAAMLALVWSVPRLMDGAPSLPPEISHRRLVK